MNLSVIGGDYRNVKLIELLSKDNNTIYVWGFERSKELTESKNTNIIFVNTIKEAIDKSEIVIGAIPFSKDKEYIFTKYTNQKVKINELSECIKDKIFFAGAIPNEILNIKNAIDILNDEGLTILNAISTAEGTIEVIMRETIKTIYNSNILVMGYGRIGKILVDRLQGLKANVYCSARGKDLTWINTYGANALKYDDLNESLHRFDIIINTVPVMLLSKERLKYIKKDTLLIDVASNPGGIDFEEAKQLGIKTFWELGIPGKATPLSSAEFIKNTIYKIIKERGDNK